MSPASNHIAPAKASVVRLIAIVTMMVACPSLMAPAHAAADMMGGSASATASVTIERPAVVRSERLFETGSWVDHAGENRRAPASRIERDCPEEFAPEDCRMVIYDLP